MYLSAYLTCTIPFRRSSVIVYIFEPEYHAMISTPVAEAALKEPTFPLSVRVVSFL